MTFEVIGIISTIIIATAMHFHVKGAFITGLVFGTFSYWIYESKWPETISDTPHFELNPTLSNITVPILFLLINLTFLYILTVNGIAKSMVDLLNLTSNIDNHSSIPRGHWLFIVCGLATILSGYFSGNNNYVRFINRT